MSPVARMPRYGFTLVELLTVIAIIAILFGMLMSGLSLLRAARTKTETMRLMKDVAMAVSQYLADYPELGDTPADFSARPWNYLRLRPAAQGKTPYLELPARFLAAGTPPMPATENDAEVILDPYGEPLGWTITAEAGVGGLAFTAEVEVRSGRGDFNPDNDLIMRWEHISGQWEGP